MSRAVDGAVLREVRAVLREVRAVLRGFPKADEDLSDRSASSYTFGSVREDAIPTKRFEKQTQLKKLGFL